MIEENGVLAFVEFVLLPAAYLRGTRKFIVERERDALEPLVYSTIAPMHADYKADVVRTAYALPSSSANKYIANTSTIKTSGGKGFEWSVSTYPDCLPRFRRVEGGNPESIPPTREEAEKGEEQGHWLP